MADSIRAKIANELHLVDVLFAALPSLKRDVSFVGEVHGEDKKYENYIRVYKEF
jgi:hypothetical protein